MVYLGGPAGNSRARLAPVPPRVLDPTNIKLIGEQPFEVTNWDPAETQRVITAAAKFPRSTAGRPTSALPSQARFRRSTRPIARSARSRAKTPTRSDVPRSSEASQR